MFHLTMVRALVNDKYIALNLFLYDESPGDPDNVFIETSVGDEKYSYEADNFFSALQGLRRKLEKDLIFLICNGTALNVFPSPMAMSMGNGRKAYKLALGRQAALADLVDIFETDETLNFSRVDEQIEFYNLWLQSLGT